MFSQSSIGENSLIHPKRTLCLESMSASVTCVQFSHDGLCIAVGYSSSPGLSIWSFSGKLLMNTTNEEQESLYSPFEDIKDDLQAINALDSYLFGVKTMVLSTFCPCNPSFGVHRVIPCIL